VLYGQIVQPDVWAYDYESNTWIRRQTAVSPPTRNAHGVAYDSRAGKVILFGGSGDIDNLADTWVYDYAGNTWTEMTPAVSPPKRSYGSLAYDGEAGVAVLFGGLDADLLGDTWTYDLATNTWTERSSAQSPPPRAWHDLAYSAKANAVVMFGGGVDRTSFTNEVWMYRTAPNRWTAVP